MKKVLTAIFAIAVMVFAFSADVFAGAESPTKFVEEIDELRDTDQAGNESEVADSGNEGPTSAAQESDQ